jgi:hypothetical protein
VNTTNELVTHSANPKVNKKLNRPQSSMTRISMEKQQADRYNSVKHIYNNKKCTYDIVDKSYRSEKNYSPILLSRKNLSSNSERRDPTPNPASDRLTASLAKHSKSDRVSTHKSYFNSLKKEEIETDDAKIENDDAIEDQDIVKSQEKPSKSKDNYAKTELFEKDMAERMNSLEIVV